MKINAKFCMQLAEMSHGILLLDTAHHATKERQDAENYEVMERDKILDPLPSFLHIAIINQHYKASWNLQQ